MSSLSDLQKEFAKAVPGLISKAFELGFGVTVGEAWRTPEQAAWNAAHGLGVANSLHTERLAIDLNLFSPEGAYLSDDSTGAYSQLGAYWKSQGVNYKWGGDFKPLVDLDHFSLSPDGVRG